MYDNECVKKRERKKLNNGNSIECAICDNYQINTASEYEWPCLILKHWICETHCSEIQLKSGNDTRNKAKVIIECKEDSESLLDICTVCPYRDIVDTWYKIGDKSK